MILIKNGELYSPYFEGRKDVLLSNNKIEYVSEKIKNPGPVDTINKIDASNKLIVPGFIDAHVHICGGGGESGYNSRTTEIHVSELINGGVTTVVGCLGTDGISRSVENLLAKAYSLEEEGISTYIYAGSYQLPLNSITGSVERDIMFIPKIIGVGELALSDNRSSYPSYENFKTLTAKVRLAGLLSGKAGILNIHIGLGKEMLELIELVVKNTDIPVTQFYPTHINRSRKLLQRGIAFAKTGGYIDFTTGMPEFFLENGVLKPGKALAIAIQEGVNSDQITFTSDGQASIPSFDIKGNVIEYTSGSSLSLYRDVRSAVLEENIPLETALKMITTNPARILKLTRKGEVKEGYDADLILLNKQTLEIETVISAGKIVK